MPTNDFPLLAVILGWPAVIASVALVFVGIARKRERVVLSGGVLALPFMLYLLASPRIGWLSLAVGALHLGSSRAVAQDRSGLALAMVSPFVALTGFVASLVVAPLN